MDESERKRAAVRYDCMQWAMHSAVPGEDPMKVLARAQLYEEYVSTGPWEADHPLNLKQARVDKR